MSLFGIWLNKVKLGEVIPSIQTYLNIKKQRWVPSLGLVKRTSQDHSRM